MEFVEYKCGEVIVIIRNFTSFMVIKKSTGKDIGCKGHGDLTLFRIT